MRSRSCAVRASVLHCNSSNSSSSKVTSLLILLHPQHQSPLNQSLHKHRRNFSLSPPGYRIVPTPPPLLPASGVWSPKSKTPSSSAPLVVTAARIAHSFLGNNWVLSTATDGSGIASSKLTAPASAATRAPLRRQEAVAVPQTPPATAVIPSPLLSAAVEPGAVFQRDGGQPTKKKKKKKKKKRKMRTMMKRQVVSSLVS